MNAPKNIRARFLLCGIILSIAAAGLFMKRIPHFSTLARSLAANPLESTDYIQNLYKYNQILYRSLCNRQNLEDTDYVELYYPIREGSLMERAKWAVEGSPDSLDTLNTGEENTENVPSEHLLHGNTDTGSTDIPDATESPEPLSEDYQKYRLRLEELYSDYQEAVDLLNSYFSAAESDLRAMSAACDYYICDTETGEILTNTADTQSLLTGSGYHFLLEFCYDEDGRASVGQIAGDDAGRLLRLATGITEQSALASDIALSQKESPAVNRFRQYAGARPIMGCRILYGISEDTWKKLLYGDLETEYTPFNAIYGTASQSYHKAGMDNFLLLLLLAVMAAAFLLPYIPLRAAAAEAAQVLSSETAETTGTTSSSKPATTTGQTSSSESAAGARRAPSPEFATATEQPLFPTRAPLELSALLVFFIFPACARVITTIAYAAGGSETETLSRQFWGLTDGARKSWLMLLTFVLLCTIFFTAWYVGASLRPVRVLGIRGYLQKKSLIYRFFPYIRDRAVTVRYALTHMDITKNADRILRRILLVNAVLVFILAFLWGPSAVFFTIIYTVVLYLLLRRYLSRLQEQYKTLLAATNEIAEGHLDAPLDEDLGVFEPFKPQIIRIRQGFRKAVDEEIKSQRLKTELITNVSHDLKTPLTAIITYIGLLKEENITPQQRGEYLDTLERKSLRLKALIEDLFEISKAASRSVSLNLVDVDLMSLVRQVRFEMADQFERARLDVRVNLPEKAVLTLDSDKTCRIYENLMGNIAKYALPGSRVYLTGSARDGHVTVTLKNISAAEIHVDPAELTDRFVRGDESRGTDGSGLGLAIAKSFTELMGGQLTVELDDDVFKVTTSWPMREEINVPKAEKL